MSKRHDIFNPEYQKEKNFFRKQNIYRIIFASLLIGLFLYGSRDFIFSSISYIEIRNMRYKVVESAIIPPNNTIGYFCINRNPYNIILVISEINGITSNYDKSVIGYNDFVYVSFTSTLSTVKVINIGGIKYG